MHVLCIFSTNLTLGIGTKDLHSMVRSRKPAVVPIECPQPKTMAPKLKVPASLLRTERVKKLCLTLTLTLTLVCVRVWSQEQAVWSYQQGEFVLRRQQWLGDVLCSPMPSASPSTPASSQSSLAHGLFPVLKQWRINHEAMEARASGPHFLGQKKSAPHSDPVRIFEVINLYNRTV